MTRLSMLLAAVLLTSSGFQAESAQGDGKGPPTQCWDQTTNQVRQRTAADSSKEVPSQKGAPADSSTVGSSEGMAGLTPGSKGPASKQAATEPSGSARPPADACKQFHAAVRAWHLQCGV
jgi:hypothetical protein